MTHSVDPIQSLSGPLRCEDPVAPPPFADLRLLVVPAPDRADNDLLLLRALAWTRIYGGNAFVLDVMAPEIELVPLGNRFTTRSRAAEPERECRRIALERNKRHAWTDPFPSERDLLESIEIAAKAIGASLVMVPRQRQHGWISRWSFEHLALAVVQRTERPCLVVGKPRATSAILAATDLSDPHFPVVHYAASIASRIDGDVRLLHNLDSPAVGLAGPSALLAGLDSLGSAEEIQETLRKIAGEDAQVLLLNEPDTAAAIVHAAEELQADLIVAGTHRPQHFRLLPRFSTAEEITRRASCCVLLVPLYREA